MKTNARTLGKAPFALAALFIMLVPEARGCALGRTAKAASTLRVPMKGFTPANAPAGWGSATIVDPAANSSIVGFWHVLFFVGNTTELYDQGLEQFYVGGIEMTNDVYPPALENVCWGVWGSTGPRTYKLKHFAWDFDASGATVTGNAVVFATMTLEASGATYHGEYLTFQVDLEGNEIPGTRAQGVLKATRITLD